MRIKIYGERHTGTNYLHQLLRLNTDARLLSGQLPKAAKFLPEPAKDLYFKCLTGNLGWKHRELTPPFIDKASSLQNIKFVFIAKNPYAWCLSLARNPYHYSSGRADPSLRDLLTMEWKTLGRESDIRHYQNIIDMWNRKTLSYKKLSEVAECRFIRYETLLTNFESSFVETVADLGLTASQHRPNQIEKSTKSDGRTHDEISSYYIEKKYLNNISQSDMALISQLLSDDAMQVFGYDYE